MNDQRNHFENADEPPVSGPSDVNADDMGEMDYIDPDVDNPPESYDVKPGGTAQSALHAASQYDDRRAVPSAVPPGEGAAASASAGEANRAGQESDTAAGRSPGNTAADEGGRGPSEVGRRAVSRRPALWVSARVMAVMFALTAALGAGGWVYYEQGGRIFQTGPSGSDIARAAATDTSADRGAADQAQIDADAAAADRIRSGETSAGAGESSFAGGEESRDADGGVPMPGMDRAAVSEMIEARIAEAQDAQDQRIGERLASVEQRISALRRAAQDDSALLPLRERIASLEQSIAGVEASANALIERRLAERETSGGTDEGGAQRTADLAERIESLEAITSNVYTALANSRLALEALRTGRYSAKRDWREIADAGEADESLAAAADEEGGEPDPQGAETITGWDLVGIGEGQAMIRSPSGAVYRVEPGDRVEQIGVIRAIEPARYAVVLSGGEIRADG